MKKFRVWNSKIGGFISPSNLLANVDTEGGISFASTVGPQINTKDLIIQQFTGLLDKNGKEIFEGDIVENIVSEYISVVRFSDTCGAFIFYPHSQGGLEGFQSETQFVYTQDTMHLREIIGNIFQNAELLKQ